MHGHERCGGQAWNGMARSVEEWRGQVRFGMEMQVVRGLVWSVTIRNGTVVFRQEWQAIRRDYLNGFSEFLLMF